MKLGSQAAPLKQGVVLAIGALGLLYSIARADETPQLRWYASLDDDDKSYLAVDVDLRALPSNLVVRDIRASVIFFRRSKREDRREKFRDYRCSYTRSKRGRVSQKVFRASVLRGEIRSRLRVDVKPYGRRSKFCGDGRATRKHSDLQLRSDGVGTTSWRFGGNERCTGGS